MEELQLGGWWKRSVGTGCIDFVQVPGSYEPLGECTLEREFRWTPRRIRPSGVISSAPRECSRRPSSP